MRLFAARRSHGAALVFAMSLAACSGPAAAPGATPAAAPTPTTAVTPSAATQVPTTTPDTSASAGEILGSLPPEPPGTVWTRVTGPGASFSFEVPSAWTDIDAGAWDEGGTTIGYVVGAGTDTAKIGSDFSAAGVLIGLSANPTGLTPRQIVESDDTGPSCTVTPTAEVVEAGYRAAYRSWESCGVGATGFLLSMAVAPNAGGLMGVLLQGTRQEDLGYIEHIMASVETIGSTVTPPPGPTTPEPGTGQTYSITMDVCQNQHGQGIAEGFITNTDTVEHSFRVEVWFYNPVGVLLNTSASFASPGLPPGQVYRWQSVVASGLPSTDVTCEIKKVTIEY